MRTTVAAVRMALLLGASLIAAPPAGGQTFRYAAFGDSITAGKCDNVGACLPIDQGAGGYPTRLREAAYLGCEAGVDCEVVNEGLGGEATSEGVTRIDDVLDSGLWDVVLLMEGTNDVFQKAGVSNETIVFNLETIAGKAASRGVDTVQASIIWLHPESKWGADGSGGEDRNPQVELLRSDISDMATAAGRWFVDAWLELCPVGQDRDGHQQPDCFGSLPDLNGHYGDAGSVGHPNSSGYDFLADRFFEVLGASPPGGAVPVSPTGDTGPTPTFSWSREVPEAATWYLISVEDDGGVVYQEWVEAAAVCSGGGCQHKPGSELPGGDLTWRVRSRNPAGYGSWSGSLAFRVYAAPPEAPVAVAPAGNLYLAEPAPVTFAWDEAPEALVYDLEVLAAGVPVIATSFGAADVCSGGSCSATPVTPLGAGDYSWTVTGRNPAGVGAASARLEFTIYDSAPPSGPVPLAPVAPIFDTTPVFSWSAVAGTESYDLTALGSGGDSLMESYDAGAICVGVVCTARPATALSPDDYLWQAAAVNPLGSVQGSVAAFSILVCDPIELILEGYAETGVVVQRACETVSAGDVLGRGDAGHYTVVGGADVTLHGGQSVVLYDGFEVEPGCRLELRTDPE